MATLTEALKSDLDIDNKRRGVFAYLSAVEDITVVTGDTFQPLTGTFTNSPLESFTGTAEPSIKYTDGDTNFFEIDWHISASVDSNTNKIHVGMYHKPSGGSFSLVAGSVMGSFAKTSGEPISFSGTAVVELEENDEIQIVIKSLTTGDVITVNHFVTTIAMFFLT